MAHFVESDHKQSNMFCRTSLPWFTTAIFVCVLLISWDDPLASTLAFTRGAVGRGEIWRLVTCHLTHWNADHLLWDALMFGVLGAVVENRGRSNFIGLVIGSAVAISLGTWFLEPSIYEYRGLSGIDSALFTSVAATQLLEARRSDHRLVYGLSLAALVGFLCKIGFEIATQHTLFVDSADAGFVPVPTAHLIGAAAGLASVASSGRWRAKAAIPPCAV